MSTNLLKQEHEHPSAHPATTAPKLEKRIKNLVQKIREQQLMSKAELARKAGVSALTIDRVEQGMPCRMDTMRKIILALGFTLNEKEHVFPENN